MSRPGPKTRDAAWVIVVAAGSGTRFGGPKQFRLLGGRPIVEWSLAAARAVADGIVLVVPPGEGVGAAGPDAEVAAAWRADVIVTGAATRSGSVRAGLDAVPPDVGVIVVHDAARPLAPVALFRRVIDAVSAGADGALPGMAVSDTVKQVDDEGAVAATLDRSRLVMVQTPQAFSGPVLRAAHSGRPEATDDAALVESAGGRVVVVPGESTNLKITHAADLALAEALLAAGPPACP